MYVLHAFGTRFAADRFAAKTSLDILAVRKRGQPRFPHSKPRGAKHKVSGITVVVSDASWTDLAAQISDADRLLESNGREIGRLQRWPGVQMVVLDFPIDLRVSRKNVAQFDRFPASLVRKAGRLGLALELSIYRTGRR